MNTGIMPKKKTPSFFGGLFVLQVRYAQNLGVLWYKRFIQEEAGRSYCHICAAFLRRSIMAIPIPVSGKGSARITSTFDSCNS